MDLACSSSAGCCMSTFCISSAASQLSGRRAGEQAGGLKRKGLGESRRRTVVERVDHVVHDPEGLVAVEGRVRVPRLFAGSGHAQILNGLHE